MSLFARIDHAAAAQAAGLELRPTEVMLFGNPAVGTYLMQDVQALGIELPLKALIWQDEDGKTFISYQEPAELAARYGAHPSLAPRLQAMGAAMAAVAHEAAEDV